MTQLTLPRSIRDAMIDQTRREWPCECCGLLLGKRVGESAVVESSIPLVNELQSSNAFRSEPKSMFAAIRTIRESNAEIVAVYHSHPMSKPVPSERDCKELVYLDAFTCIVGMESKFLSIRVWQFRDGQFSEVKIESV